MIRILHVIGSLNSGGSQSMIMNIYRKIDREKIQFDFVIMHNDERFYEKEILELGGRVIYLPQWGLKNIFKFNKAWNKFFIEHPEYKIIHGHVRSTASLYLKIAKKNGLKTIVHSHSTSNGKGISAVIKNILQKNIKKVADQFIGCSMNSAKWLFGEEIAKSNRCTVLNNAIDTTKYNYSIKVRSLVRKELGINDNDIIVGHVGRFSEMKNHKFLVEIFEQLHKMDKRYKLLLIGNGELQEEIKIMVKERYLDKQVIFTGVRKDVNNLLQAMDIFVMPSIYEGLPVTLVEAQASNLPCLITDSISEEINITNLVYRESLDSTNEIWAARIKEIYSKNNRECSEKIIDKIKKSGYDISTTTEQLSKMYFKLLEEK